MLSNGVACTSQPPPSLAGQQVLDEQRGGAGLTFVRHRVPRAPQRGPRHGDLDELSFVQLTCHRIPGHQGGAEPGGRAGHHGTLDTRVAPSPAAAQATTAPPEPSVSLGGSASWLASSASPVTRVPEPASRCNHLVRPTSNPAATTGAATTTSRFGRLARITASPTCRGGRAAGAPPGPGPPQRRPRR